ncbi:MAG: YbaB/EbfC family nucleoid-associated protein, partial [Clostridiaceae bacterium]
MAKGGFPGMGGMNMNNLMKQAQKMQQQMEKMQAELEEKEFTATAGGGVVKVTVNGKKQILDIEIDPEAVDPDDVEMLQDLILTACNQALQTADEETSS